MIKFVKSLYLIIQFVISSTSLLCKLEYFVELFLMIFENSYVSLCLSNCMHTRDKERTLTLTGLTLISLILIFLCDMPACLRLNHQSHVKTSICSNRFNERGSLLIDIFKRSPMRMTRSMRHVESTLFDGFSFPPSFEIGKILCM